MTLKMFYNDSDYVIAESPEDATKVYLEQIGDPGFRDDEWNWRELPMEKHQKWWTDPSDGSISAPDEAGAVLTSLTVAEMIEKFGRGYCGSHDY